MLTYIADTLAVKNFLIPPCLYTDWQFFSIYNRKNSRLGPP